MSGHLNLYKYYCVTENKWILEEKNNTDLAPTQCKNDPSHTIKNDSIHIAFRGYHEYCKVKPISGVENYNTPNLNTETMSLQDVARRLLVLEKCALLKGLITEDTS